MSWCFMSLVIIFNDGTIKINAMTLHYWISFYLIEVKSMLSFYGHYLISVSCVLIKLVWGISIGKSNLTALDFVTLLFDLGSWNCKAVGNVRFVMFECMCGVGVVRQVVDLLHAAGRIWFPHKCLCDYQIIGLRLDVHCLSVVCRLLWHFWI